MPKGSRTASSRKLTPVKKVRTQKRIPQKPATKKSASRPSKKSESKKQIAATRRATKSTSREIKKQSKETKKITKSLSKTATKTSKKISKVASRQGKKVGKSLGKRIGAAIKAARNKQVVKSKKVKRSNKVFSIRQAPIPKKKTMGQTLLSFDENADEFDKLKGENEYWGFSFFGNRSWQVFENIDKLTKKLRDYPVMQGSINKRGKTYDEIAKSIKLIRFDGTPKVWRQTKLKEFKSNQKKHLAEAKEKAGLKRKVKKLEKANKKLRREKRKQRKH